MSIDELRIFVAVAQTLNFTQAAEELHFSQPTLSRRISDLEREIGHELFVRTTRKVNLTEFGRSFLSEAKRLLKSYDQLLDQMSNLGKKDFGSLSIGTPALMTGTFLPKVISSFSKKYPGVTLEMRAIQPGECLNMLKNEIIDIGFFASTDIDFSYPNIKVSQISSGQLVLVTGSSHRLADESIVEPSDLSGDRIYLSNRNNTPFLWSSVNQMLTLNNISTACLEEVDNPSVIAMLVEAGLGVTFVASNLLKELPNAASLHFSELKGMNVSSQLNVAWNRNSENVCLKHFIKELDSHIPIHSN